jgi:myo-inositol 2-dehydrogenase/D-chiro-inositol 1-dehydrogenase
VKEVRTVKLGIIGMGYIGKIHLRHCLKIPNAEVQAVADVSAKALKNAKKDGIKKTFNNYSDLLKDSEIDAVIIGLPTHLHLQCAREAAEAGKDIFLEKPMAINVEEAKEIISAVQRNSVKLMMGYPMRFNKEFGVIKEKIEKGLIGDVENAYATFIGTGPFFHRAEGHAPVPVPEWWFNQELTGGGVLVDMGSHMINLMRWYFGEITDIKGYFGHRFNMDFEDSAMCLTKFDSRTVALINVGWFSQAYTLKLDFFGSVKTVSAQHLPSRSLVSMLQMLITGKSKFYQAHFDELQYFVDCLQNDSTLSPSGEDGLKDLEAITQAYKNQIRLE